MEEHEQNAIKDFLEMIEHVSFDHIDMERRKNERREKYGDGSIYQRELEDKAVEKADKLMAKGDLDQALVVLGEIIQQAYGDRTMYLWLIRYYSNQSSSTYRTHIESCIDRWFKKYDEATLGERKFAYKTEESLADYRDDLEAIYKDWKKANPYHNSRADFINKISRLVEDDIKTERFDRVYSSIYGEAK